MKFTVKKKCMIPYHVVQRKQYICTINTLNMREPYTVTQALSLKTNDMIVTVDGIIRPSVLFLILFAHRKSTTENYIQ